jgi:ribosomal protein S18 acetylase RimI-like enzyme
MRIGEYEIVEGVAAVDFERVHNLLASSYWAYGVSRADVEKAARHSSLILSAFHGGVQVGYLRVVSDFTTFGWISDVIVDPAHQRRGLGRAMVQLALRHPEHQGFRRWVLKTRDAQAVYRACGFRPVEHPEQWMDYRPPDAPPSHEDDAGEGA